MNIPNTQDELMTDIRYHINKMNDYLLLSDVSSTNRERMMSKKLAENEKLIFETLIDRLIIVRSKGQYYAEVK